MATCPSGHESASDDFCDVCGVLIGAAPTLGADQAAAGATQYGATVVGPVAGGPVAGGQAPAEACPRCGIARAGQFCESCGYDFTAGPVPPAPVTVTSPAPPPPAPPPPPPPPPPAAPAVPSPAPGPPALASWTAVVTADRAYYDSVQAEGAPDAAEIAFPAYCPQRRFPLDRDEVRIGRPSARTGVGIDIDLTGPPADPGVSRLHAVLLKTADGSWAVVDPGSANGTLVNGKEIPHDQLVPLHDGDRIHLGAWTELRLVREG
jgi:hypothetical protein